MLVFRTLFAAVIFACACGAARSDIARLEVGGDSFVAGAVVTETLSAKGDAFVSGRTVSTGGRTDGDLHVAGFDATISTDSAADVYAAGATVLINGAIAEDLTAAGFTLRTTNSARTTGNARLFGNSVTIDGPVGGALVATGQDVVLNAAISGDARIVARTLTFGPNATVAGTLTYSTRNAIAVPERVAPAGRVVAEPFKGSGAWSQVDNLRKEMPMLPTFASMFVGFIISLLFFVVLGALVLGLVPKRLERMCDTVASAPGQSLLLGVIGLSVLFGLVPITGLTIVGLPFVPIAILAIVVMWTLGYALGAYSVAMRLWTGFGGQENPGTLPRLAVFAAAITFVALLNFIPFVGWVANYTLVLLGIGAMTHALFQYLIGNPGRALDVDMNPVRD